MTAPNPQTIANDIETQISALILAGGPMMSEDTAAWTAIWDLCAKLQSVDVVRASGHKADLYQLVGDVERFEYWANNALKNGGRDLALRTLSAGYANLGFATKSAASLDTFARTTDLLSPSNYLNGIASASFVIIVESAAKWQKAGGNIDAESKGIVMAASKACAALSEIGVDESVVRRMMDEAGVILRERRQLWLNEAPDVLTSSSDEDPYLALNYRVKLPPTDAATMTWELANRLAAVGLMPDAVTIGFIGEPRASVE